MSENTSRDFFGRAGVPGCIGDSWVVKKKGIAQRRSPRPSFVTSVRDVPPKPVISVRAYHLTCDWGPNGGVFSIQAKRQAFRAPSRFEEFSQLGAVGRIAAVRQVGFEFGAPGIQHDVSSDDDGI